MKNPFDKTFFRFLLGFTFILSVNFAILFLVARFGFTNESQQGAVANSQEINK